MKRTGAASSMTIGGGVSGNGVGDAAGAGNHHQHHNQLGSTFSQRLNMDGQVRELKLGSTFNTRNTSTAFHTIKYDFKPASVDFNKVASFNVEPNNLVTVTVPNVESSGVPNTVYKGNHKKYTKECLLIIDRDTGVVTLEKLNHNILVKKTRAKGPSGPAPLPSLENSTKRISSKTKVSTGNRKTNSNIINAPSGSRGTNSSATVNTGSSGGGGGGSSGTALQGMSPLQSSLGMSGNTRSPIQAPEWKANAAQSTLPSVPMLLDDDDDSTLMSFPPQNLFAANQRQSQSPGSSGGGYSGASSGNTNRHKSQKKPQQNHLPPQTQSQPHSHQQQQQLSQHLQPQQQQSTFSNNHSNNSSIFGGGTGGQTAAVSRPGDYSQLNGSNGSGGNSIDHMDQVVGQVNNLNQDIGYLSSSSSSGSDSESSSDSDSSDSDSDGDREMTSNHQQTTGMSMPSVPMQMQSMPLVSSLMASNGGELLQNDLQLSESESDDSD
ncbi:EAF1 family protein [Megaselia abdita]